MHSMRVVRINMERGFKMLTKYLLEFRTGDSEEAIDLTRAGAEELITEYIGKTIVFKGKDHKIKSGRFDSTRGIVLTDTNGTNFIYAKIMDVVREEGEEEPEKIVKPKRKAMGRPKKPRYTTYEGEDGWCCNNCDKRVPKEGHTQDRCQKLGGPVPKESPKKSVGKKKPKKKSEELEEQPRPYGSPGTRVQVGVVERKIIREAVLYFDPILALSEHTVVTYLLKLGIRELRRKHGRNPETGK